MRAVHRPGIGAVTQSERRGFTERDQALALAECKQAQHRLQLGMCILCTRLMNLRRCAWVSARGATATLSRWARAMKKDYYSQDLHGALEHKSPDEIRAEYSDGNRGHELACQGCAQRVHYALYGANGAGAAYDRRYARLVNERGLTEDQQADPTVAMGLHYEVVNFLAQGRMARLSEVRGSVQPEDVEVTPKVRKVRSRRTKRGVANRMRLIGTGPEADRALQVEREYQASLPEGDLERKTRELMADYGCQLPATLA